MPLLAKQALWKQLIADGVEVVFGNPGTFEQGMLDALRNEPGLLYAMGLQEAAVLAMATNYARLGRRGAVVQLHAGVGLGNAMGAMQEALRGYVPMLILCGENATTWEPFDGYLACDLVELARPVTKWAVRASSADSLPRILRRAWSMANTPPRGPVLLAVPMDVLESAVAEEITATPLPDMRTIPHESALLEIARALRDANSSILVIGDGLAWSRGEHELVSLAEHLGAPIFGLGLTMAGRLLGQPSFAGFLPLTSGSSVAEVTRRADVLLCVGTTLGSEIFPEPDGNYIQSGARLYQIDLVAEDVGKNVAPTLGIVADPKATLVALLSVLLEQGGLRRASTLADPRNEASTQATRGLTATAPQSDGIPVASATRIIANCLPQDSLVLDESMTATEWLRSALRGRTDVEYLSCLSRGLGSGWPAGVSAKLLHPNRKVVAISADGAALYVVTTLWTAARLKLDVVFIALNNRSYQILKYNIMDYWKRVQEPMKPFPFMDLDAPVIRFDRLGEGFGLTGWLVEDEAALQAAVTSALAADGPHVIDVHVGRTV